MNCLTKLFENYKSLIFFDTETTGLNFENDRIIELGAIKVERNESGQPEITDTLNHLISMPENRFLPPKIVQITGITDEALAADGVDENIVADEFCAMINPGPTLLIAHNAHFDACFLRKLLQGHKMPEIAWIDTLTVYRDRREYPHRLENAIIEYGLEGQVVNSHRAIDDTRSLYEVFKKMDSERDDLDTYVNVFGFNPKYGVEGTKVRGVEYFPQGFNKGIVRAEATLPALNKPADSNQDTLF